MIEGRRGRNSQAAGGLQAALADGEEDQRDGGEEGGGSVETAHGAHLKSVN